MDKEAAVFGKRMFSVVLDGYLSLGLAIGAEQGLFKAMSEFDEPATATEVARKAHCKERYVREWLGWMVAGQVVESYEEGHKYFLPLSHRAALASKMVQEYSTYIPRMTASHPHLMEAFKEEGPPGVPYSVTAPLLHGWQKDRPRTFQRVMPGIFKLAPGLEGKIQRGLSVCDIGCGEGHLVSWLASTYPNCTVGGIDVEEESVTIATKSLTERGLTNTSVSLNDAARLPVDWSNKFDLVLMYDVLHDIPHASKACSEFYRILKPGGEILVIDINVNSDPGKNKGDANASMCFPFSLYHCMSTSLSVDGSEGLGTCAGVQKFENLLTDGGFKTVKSYDLGACKIEAGLVLLTAVKEGEVLSQI